MLLGSVVLEVAFGMIFVYLLMSLVCSAAGEYIEAKFNNRAKYLRRGIELLLNETKGGGAESRVGVVPAWSGASLVPERPENAVIHPVSYVRPRPLEHGHHRNGGER